MSKKKVSQQQIDENALLPDLRAIPARDFHIQDTESNGNNVRYLRFSQGFANVGKGPLQVRRGGSGRYCQGRGRATGYQDIFFSDGSRKSVRLKECMVYHPYHKHWHVARVARYDLCTVDPDTLQIDQVIRSSDKVSFCLIDEFRIPEQYYNGPRYSKNYTSCKKRISGITPGWIDEYDYKTYGQWVDITGVEDGLYYLRSIINPSRLLIESTSSNNTAERLIRIYGNGEYVQVFR
jgi:hypothetical protein